MRNIRFFFFIVFVAMTLAATAKATDETPEEFVSDVRRKLESGDSQQLFQLAFTQGLNEMSLPFHQVRFSVISKKFLPKEFKLDFLVWPSSKPTTVENDWIRMTFLTVPTNLLKIHAVGQTTETDIDLPVAKINGHFYFCPEQLVLKRAIEPSDLVH